MSNKLQKIKVWTFVSLDGFVSRMGGDIDWILDYPRPTKGDYGLRAFRDSAGCVVISGIYYAMLTCYDLWPFGGLSCHIITPQRLSFPDDRNIHFIMVGKNGGDSYIDCLQALQREENGDIWVAGGQEIITPLMERGLVDEITTNLIPQTLGNGVPLFGHSGKERDWTPQNLQMFDNKVIQTEYTINRNFRNNTTCCDIAE